MSVRVRLQLGLLGILTAVACALGPQNQSVAPPAAPALGIRIDDLGPADPPTAAEAGGPRRALARPRTARITAYWPRSTQTIPTGTTALAIKVYGPTGALAEQATIAREPGAASASITIPVDATRSLPVGSNRFDVTAVDGQSKTLATGSKTVSILSNRQVDVRITLAVVETPSPNPSPTASPAGSPTPSPSPSATGNRKGFQLLSTKLRTGRGGGQAVAIGTKLYVIGGWLATTGKATDGIDVATIQGDGSLTQFQPAGISLKVARSSFGVVKTGTYVYVLGGGNASDDLSAIERAIIQEDGSLSQFEVYAKSLTRSRTAFCTVTAGGKIFVIGGYGPPYLSSIESTTIAGDDLSGFSVEANGLPDARNTLQCAAFDGNLVVAGGANGVVFLSSVIIATLSQTGDLGTFKTAGSLSVQRSQAPNLVVGDKWFVMGGLGRPPSGGSETVWASTETVQSSGGVLGTFAAQTGLDLNAARREAAFAETSEHVYVLGGFGPNTIYLDSIEVAAKAEAFGQ